MKREVKGIVVAVKENEDRKIAEQLELNISEALRCVFGMVSRSNKEKKDVVAMSCIHGRAVRLMVTLEEKTKVRKEYEERLLNKENK